MKNRPIFKSKLYISTSIFCAFFLSLFIVSCTKEFDENKILQNQGSSELVETNKGSKSLHNSIIGNNLNSYLDLFALNGEWHNEVMDEIGLKIDVKDRELSVIYDILKVNINNEYPNLDYRDFNSYSEMIQNARINNNLHLDVSADLGAKFDEWGLDYKSISLIEDFEVQLNGLLRPDNLLTPDEFSRELLKYKLSLILENGAPVVIGGKGNDVAMILLGSAIAEYSYQYWYDALYTSDSIWYGVFGNDGDVEPPAARRGFLKRMLSDVRGFFWGGGSHSSDGTYSIDVDMATSCAAEYSGSV